MEKKDSSGSGRRRRIPRASEAVRERRAKRKAMLKIHGLYDDDDVPDDPDLLDDETLCYGFDVDHSFRLVKSKWGDDYDIALFARLGLHCHNFQKGTNFEFVRWEKYSILDTAYTSYYITLDAKDPSSHSNSFSFQTLLRDASYNTHSSTWSTLACRVKSNEVVDDYWDETAVDDFYKSAILKWSSDEELARAKKTFYVVQESELQEIDWLHLFTEIAFYVKTEGDSTASPPLEIEKVVVVTKEEYTTEAREILKAKNAIFYISYKYNGDSSRGWAGDHKATIRKTMDGKPGHMCLEVASYRTEEEEEEEEKRKIAKFMAVFGHNP